MKKHHQFRKLIIWQRAMSFVAKIYTLTSHFPGSEQFGLTSQLRRAAVSIALNIAEGSGVDSSAEFKRFLQFAKRSAYEVITGLEISSTLMYVPVTQVEPLITEAEEICAMIVGFSKQLGQNI